MEILTQVHVMEVGSCRDFVTLRTRTRTAGSAFMVAGPIA